MSPLDALPARPSPPPTGRRRRLALAALAAFLLASPGTAPARAAEAPEDLRDAVAAADRALAAAVAARDVAAFRRLLAGDVVFLGDTVARGPAAAAEAWAPFFEENGSRLAWEPREVVVADSGDLAYSSGGYRLTPAGGDLAAPAVTGTYLTLWRRHPEHGWQVVADGSRADDDEALVERALHDLELAATPELDPRLERGDRPRTASRAGDLAYAVRPLTLRLQAPEGPLAATATLLSLWRADDPVDPAAQAVSTFHGP